MKLFDESEDNDNENVSKIEINQEYARRYEHNKKREDLQKLEELKKKGQIDDSDDSESESEEEDDLGDSKEKDLEFFDALIKVKKRDPILKEKDAKLFVSESESEDEKENTDEQESPGKMKKKEKAMYLKDVVAKQLLEDGAEYFKEGEKERKINKVYNDEQEENRRAFLEHINELDNNDDENGELLREKNNKDIDDDNDDGDLRDEMIQKKLDEYFGEDDELDENEKFLKGYFKNTMWVGQDNDETILDELEKVSDEEEEVDMQEDYEREYNFRYQENAGDRVLGHSRVVEGSVRKKENSRKVQRKSKEDRMAIAELERKEELKHMKNLKKKEYMEKIKKLREVAGISDNGVFTLEEDDLEEEFDPKKHDKKMKKMFNDDYYGADDVNPEFCSEDEEEGEDFKKPDFDKEDLLLGLPQGWDDQEEEEEEKEGKKKRKRRPSLVEKVEIEEDLAKECNEELYKMHYEGTIGDTKVRFPYKQVAPKRFGLSGEEILAMDDSDLNQYVPLKKIAPYAMEWKVPSMKKYEQKMKNKELLQGGGVTKLSKHKMGKKKKSLIEEGVEEVKTEVEIANDDADHVSRKSKRRKRQADLKLSQSRLAAYGLVDAVPKKKKKH